MFAYKRNMQQHVIAIFIDGSTPVMFAQSMPLWLSAFNQSCVQQPAPQRTLSIISRRSHVTAYMNAEKMFHIKSWFPIRLREAANGDFPWNSKPAKLCRLDQNGPKNLRLDSVEVLPTKTTPRTSWVRAAMLRFDTEHAAKQRFSKMLMEKPLPALPVDDPVETCKAPTAHTEAPARSDVEHGPATAACVE